MKDNQHQQLFTELTAESEAPAFEELDNENAAAIGGGIAVYDGFNRTGSLGDVNSTAQLGPKIDNKISSITIKEGTWRFWDLPNFKGQSATYGPGSFNLGALNNQTSSLRKIA